MRLKTMHFTNFKRFTDTRIDGLPATARLIVLAGPNGSGKSSVFDGLKTWHYANGAPSSNWDETYGTKQGTASMSWPDHVTVEFHEPLPDGPEDRKKLIYVRTAFRNEAEFQISGFNRMQSPLDSVRVNRMIDADASVSENFQRLIAETIDGLWGSTLPDDTTKGELRDRIIGQVRSAMSSVFPDLVLSGVGGMAAPADTIGTFYFTKGKSEGFLYKNLSAGEKSAFDLLLDAVIKRAYYDHSVWCIDEPETHLNTRIQATLLTGLLDLLPNRSQMVLATHSIGFLRAAWDLAKVDPSAVAFIDMQGHDFDEALVIKPVPPTRRFWFNTLEVALGDLASLMAPEEVVLCEGRPIKDGVISGRSEFDAACYRKIFSAEMPNTDFLSVGNSRNVRDDKLEAGLAIQTIASGTRIIRLVDRDLMSSAEVAEQWSKGFRVLSRRNIEAYLLDDEVLTALCAKLDQNANSGTVLLAKREEMAERVRLGDDPDDLKKAAGPIWVRVRRILSISGGGSTWDAFARDWLAPLITPGSTVYEVLKQDVFGLPSATSGTSQ